MSAGTETVYMNVGDTRTLSFSAPTYIVGTQWTISDNNAVSFISTPGSMATSATIKALSPRTAANRCLVHCVYYYRELDPVSGQYIYQRTGYQDWEIIIHENGGGGNGGGGSSGTTVSLHLNSLSLLVGNSTNIMAYPSDNSYIGSYSWISNNTNVVSLSNQRGPLVTLTGVSSGTTVVRVSLDNGNYDEITVNVSNNGSSDNTADFQYELNEDGQSYTVYAKNPSKLSGNILIPDRYNNKPVTQIGKSAFHSSNISSVIIPNSITGIGGYAFQFCSKLSFMALSDNLTEIGNSAFYGCSNLSSIKFPSTLQTIKQYAFSDCESLQEVNLPKNVSLQGPVFSDCDNLININFEDNDNAYGYYSLDGVLYEALSGTNQLVAFPPGRSGEFKIPDKVDFLQAQAFEGCRKLTSVKFPSEINLINTQCFKNCVSIYFVEITHNITTINYEAFSGCDNLTTIKLSDGLRKISDRCFYGCKNLTSIYYNATNPVSSSVDIFPANVYNKASLYVPADAINEFKTISPWKNFENIKPYDFGGVDGVFIDPDDKNPTEIYNIYGIQVADSTEDLAPGIYIVRQGKANKKIIVY